MLAGLGLLAPPAGAQEAASTPLPSITLPPELERVLQDYARAWQAGDEAVLVSLFTPDGFVPTRNGWVRGSEAIRATYADSQGPLRLRALAYATADTAGYIVGAYGYGDTPGSPDAGKFLLALRRAPGGRWLIAADLDQSNR
jgi:ketosteroid isomerase-like protein